MADVSDKRAQGRRLREARERAGFETASAAALFHGYNPDTYIQHENGTRGYKSRALAYAGAFHVTPEWLLWGRQGSRLEEIRLALEEIADSHLREVAEDLALTTIRQLAKTRAA